MTFANSSFPLLPLNLSKKNRHVVAVTGEAKSASKRSCWHRLSVVFSLLVLCALATSARAQDSVLVGWTANPEPDIAGYIVYRGTTSGVTTGTYATVQDVGNVTTYESSGLSTGVVYYFALQAYNMDGLMSELSDEITVTLEEVNALFAAWASAGNLSGFDATPSAIPFGDGVSNTLKFAFNMNPGAADVRTLVKGAGTAGLPVISLDGSGPQQQFTVEFLRRKDSGLVYQPKISTDFGAYELMTEVPTVTDIDATWERVVIKKTVDTSTTPRLFGTVEVTMP